MLFSCKKDLNNNFRINENPTLKESSNPVTVAELKLWQKENPVAKFLALDWKNAKQKIIDGKHVIQVALLNESRMPSKGSKQITSSTIVKGFNNVNNSFKSNPPKVYFVKDVKDSLHTYLLNFIPDDPTKEFGKNNIWTGKLYEWNRNSDSLFVHEYKQNIIADRYILKSNVASNINSQIKNDSLWSWLVDVVTDVLNAIGYLLHIPGTDTGPSNRHQFGNTRGWPSFDWVGDIFNGGGGGGGSSGGGQNGNINGGHNPNSGFSCGNSFYYNYFNQDTETTNGPNAGESILSQAGVHLIGVLQITEPELQNLLLFNDVVSNELLSYLELNGYSQENKAFIYWAAGYFVINSNDDFDELLTNRTDFDTETGDVDSNTIGGYDLTQYADFDAQQDWTTIPNVIPKSQFVGWNRTLHPNWQCMEYSKEQIGILGYQISDYGATGQTFQIYTHQNGVNQTKLSQGLSYLKYALSAGIPVIVGIDDAPGHPRNLDKTTDHFIVIVGMGTDSFGKFFRFYDNASGEVAQGASDNNKLYYNSATGLITGNSQTDYAKKQPLPYTITMIRKSKAL